MSTTVRALLDYGIERFEAADISYGHGTLNALDEAAWLVLHAVGLPPRDLNRHLDQVATDAQARAARALIDRRVKTRKPAAYLIHEAWLGPHRFYVDERVIVPRSFLAELLNRGQTRVRPGSDPGLKSDLFGALAGKRYDLIVSNPPYVKAASMKTLPEEYRKEPRMALASGADGLDHTRTILAEARGHLNPRGRLWVEIGHNRKALERAYPKLAFRWPRTSGGKLFVFELAREDLPG